ncbi:TPA: phage portal protein [Escherichia coli]|uniref:portal protein n=1 Tax=Enterobacteriaceae TaxID=543 RepID=UPI0004D5C85C|nr:portal protein [Escherichia coli]EKF8271855.1 phage portal protein [Salmonella enterica]ELF3353992.1 phage portal protein [Salmonella enterica subsp. enterica serovar Rissen]MBJ2859263.1 phage portal protein [Salmonella enterica subsp. enterica serovar Derby]MCC1590033.1 phage portal protein [Salmonella enterica subsp. enterica serovar Indiana]HBN3108663.1 phage portal protein [Escherichia coli O25b:H4-ST131]HCT2876720.1 phage portal protein [Salmonella enterica subsp. enterica serovar Ago
MATKDKNKGFLSALKKAFNGGDVTPAEPVVFTSGHSVVARSGLSALRPGILGSNSDGMTSAADSISLSAELPGERLQKYNILETMAKSPTISTALNIHIAHALAPSKKTGQAFILSPKDGSDAEAVSRCEELTADLGAMINDGLPSWAMIMAIFGVSYVRPYAEQGRGITGIESSYYTLPHFVQEFYRGSQLVGFSGDYILDTHSLRRVITEPWNLVSMKNPYWTPQHKVIPVSYGTKGYSLLSDQADKPLMETQNYGTSFLEYSYEPYLNLCASLAALKSTRNNAAKIDRLIALTTNTLDPVNAANYTRGVSQALKRHSDLVAQRSINANAIPTVLNHLIPVMGDGKNGITIDTQSIPADISGIEDVMFHLRQLAASLGIDATMLGWADQMSGGLGEGGWQQTAIQAALRANWIRQAAQRTIYRLLDIHLAYKYGKVYTETNRPYDVQFNSMNTAIQEEENRELDARANFVAVISQIMDQIQNNPKLAGSDAFMRYLFTEQLHIDDDTLNTMIKEFKANESEQNNEHGMYESAPLSSGDDPENWTPEQLINFAKFVMSN